MLLGIPFAPVYRAKLWEFLVGFRNAGQSAPEARGNRISFSDPGCSVAIPRHMGAAEFLLLYGSLVALPSAFRASGPGHRRQRRLGQHPVAGLGADGADVGAVGRCRQRDGDGAVAVGCHSDGPAQVPVLGLRVLPAVTSAWALSPQRWQRNSAWFAGVRITAGRRSLCSPRCRGRRPRLCCGAA